MMAKTAHAHKSVMELFHSKLRKERDNKINNDMRLKTINDITVWKEYECIYL